MSLAGRRLPLLPCAGLLALCAAVLGAGCVSRKVATTAPNGDLRIVTVTADPDTVPIYGQSNLAATVDNPNGGGLSYTWTAYRGSIVGEGPSARYFGSYCCAGTDFIVVTVRNDQGEADTHLLPIAVTP